MIGMDFLWSQVVQWNHGNKLGAARPSDSRTITYYWLNRGIQFNMAQ